MAQYGFLIVLISLSGLTQAQNPPEFVGAPFSYTFPEDQAEVNTRNTDFAVKEGCPQQWFIYILIG